MAESADYMNPKNYVARSFARDFDDAISKKHLPGSSRFDTNQADSAAFVRVTKIRLKSLGYLGKKNKINGKVDSKYVSAVKRFQRAVGVRVVDGWVGPKTWEVLEFLCSFENHQNPEGWLKRWSEYCEVDIGDIKFNKNEAVLRSVYLRLYAYGFFDFDDRHSELNANTVVDPHRNARFFAAIQSFLRFQNLLVSGGNADERENTDSREIIDEPEIPDEHAAIDGRQNELGSEISLTLLRHVFGYDELVKKLAACAHFESLHQEYAQVVSALARIELWLSGYDVAPGSSRGQYIKRKVGPPGKKITRRISKMKEALSEFHKSHAQIVEESTEKHISQSLFKVLSEDLPSTSQLDAIDDRFEPALARLLDDEKGEGALITQLTRVTSTIWDGARRLVKSLLRWLSAKVRFFSHSITNIARYLSLRARHAFGYVRASVEIVSEGARFYATGLGSTHLGSENLGSEKLSSLSRHGLVAFGQQRDFDLRVLVDASAEPKVLYEAFAARSLQSRLYGAATRIFRHLVNVARQVASLFFPARGWLRALISLRRIAVSAAAIKADIDLLRRHQYRF